MNRRSNNEAISEMTPQQAQEFVFSNWDSFLGSNEGGMTKWKLVGRMEKVDWSYPVLSFCIERHGGLVMGSSRAELQYWRVNLEERTAGIARTSHRQIAAMAPRVDVNAIIDEIVTALTTNQADERLRWMENGEVQVLTCAEIFPKDSGYRETVNGRRSRFRDRLRSRLAELGRQCERGTGVEICTPPSSNRSAPK